MAEDEPPATVVALQGLRGIAVGYGSGRMLPHGGIPLVDEHCYSPLTGQSGPHRRNVALMQEREFPGALRAAAQGDETAFAWLWREAHPALLRYLQVVAGPAAEDVAAEVWLEIARGLARFRGGEPEFRAWLFTLARRRASNLRRYSSRHPEQLTRDDEELDQPATDDTAAAALESLATRAALELIASLPQHQAEVIILRVVVGLDVRQVAQITGRRPGAVRVAAHRGLRTLAARLAAPASQRHGVTR